MLFAENSCGSERVFLSKSEGCAAADIKQLFAEHTVLETVSVQLKAVSCDADYVPSVGTMFYIFTFASHGICFQRLRNKWRQMKYS